MSHISQSSRWLDHTISANHKAGNSDGSFQASCGLTLGGTQNSKPVRNCQQLEMDGDRHAPVLIRGFLQVFLSSTVHAGLESDDEELNAEEPTTAALMDEKVR